MALLLPGSGNVSASSAFRDRHGSNLSLYTSHTLHCRSAAVPRWYGTGFMEYEPTLGEPTLLRGSTALQTSECAQRSHHKWAATSCFGSTTAGGKLAGYNNQHSHAAMPSSSCVMTEWHCSRVFCGTRRSSSAVDGRSIHNVHLHTRLRWAASQYSTRAGLCRPGNQEARMLLLYRQRCCVL